MTKVFVKTTMSFLLCGSGLKLDAGNASHSLHSHSKSCTWLLTAEILTVSLKCCIISHSELRYRFFRSPICIDAASGVANSHERENDFRIQAHNYPPHEISQYRFVSILAYAVISMEMVLGLLFPIDLQKMM